jgi:hypothetical protein
MANGLEVILSNEQLATLADLIAARISRIDTVAQDSWLHTRAAAAYAGVHPDTLRKLAAARRISFQQEGPGCKLYFRRSALDQLRGGFQAASMHG